MLVAYRWLCHHGGNLAEGGFLLSRFHFTRCRYFLGHVTSFYTEPITHQIGCGLKVFAKFLLPKIATVGIFP